MRSIPWLRAALLPLVFAAAAAQPAHAEKVLRYPFVAAETGFDPAQVTDLYSRIVTANIFETLYEFSYLARPVTLRPALAEAMPEVSPDFRTYTIHMKRGVYFADDPAFGGRKREVTAADVVYTIKRIYDPRTRSPNFAALEEEKIVGLAQLREAAEKSGRFDYDSEAEGLQALDRYTVRFRLAVPRPRFVLSLADPGILGTVAREVVEKYGDEIMAHPVGTGAFMLAEWKRSSRMTFVRNPNWRGEVFDEVAPAGDSDSAAIAASLRGKRLPLVDKVVISVIEESQPRWLSFLNGEQDLISPPADFATYAIPNQSLAPNLSKQGIRMARSQLADVTMMYFNMEDPVVGGYSADKVALRRAVSLAQNTEEEIRLPRHGQAIQAQSLIPPNTSSYDPALRTEAGVFDRARAAALLDMYGYTDKDGDGWRDLPDGSPLTLEMHTAGTSDARALDEILKKNLDAIGVKIVFKSGRFAEQLKSARAGKMQMWQLGISATSPDSGSFLLRGASSQIGQGNHARFRNQRYDELVARQGVMPDGPQRDAVIRDAIRILTAYMPYKVGVHRVGTDLTQPWLIGYKRHPFSRGFWRFVDIDTAKAPRS